jgi:putative transposase
MIRRDFLNKTTTSLVKTKPVITIEDIKIRNLLKNHRVARSIGDEGWGMFRIQLEYKTRWYGARLIVIPNNEPSSKRCSHCGAINHNLKLSDRTWVCLNCGAVNERDPNSAINIRNKGIEILNTESLSGINVCGDNVSPSGPMAVIGETESERITKSRKTDDAVVVRSL